MQKLLRTKMKRLVFFTLTLFGGLVCELDAQSAIRYPYVVEGTNIIVSRDARGGVSLEYLRTEVWTETPDHSQTSSLNRVYSRIQVARSRPNDAEAMPWSDATDYCRNLQEDGYTNWRVPTQRELMLIYVMNDQLADGLYRSDPRPNPPEPDLSVFYWSATHDGNTSNVWSVGLSDTNDENEGKVEPYPDTQRLNYVRCVRDVVE